MEAYMEVVELHPIGAANLAQAVLRHSIEPLTDDLNKARYAQKNGKPFPVGKFYRLTKRTIEFAEHSPLITHYADAFEYDEVAIRREIRRIVIRQYNRTIQEAKKYRIIERKYVISSY